MSLPEETWNQNSRSKSNIWLDNFRGVDVGDADSGLNKSASPKIQNHVTVEACHVTELAEITSSYSWCHPHLIYVTLCLLMT
jgi:hypothetical protein